jgi:hypothetical protein
MSIDNVIKNILEKKQNLLEFELILEFNNKKDYFYFKNQIFKLNLNQESNFYFNDNNLNTKNRNEKNKFKKEYLKSFKIIDYINSINSCLTVFNYKQFCDLFDNLNAEKYKNLYLFFDSFKEQFNIKEISYNNLYNQKY